MTPIHTQSLEHSFSISWIWTVILTIIDQRRRIVNFNICIWLKSRRTNGPRRIECDSENEILIVLYRSRVRVWCPHVPSLPAAAFHMYAKSNMHSAVSICLPDCSTHYSDPVPWPHLQIHYCNAFHKAAQCAYRLQEITEFFTDISKPGKYLCLFSSFKYLDICILLMLLLF